MHIKGPFPVLSTGITLIDLPGHGDVDNSVSSSASMSTAGLTLSFLERETRSQMNTCEMPVLCSLVGVSIVILIISI